ncbi:CCDC94 [Bugula neritina]|uniref:Splicing factor YJU2 n=1 Tax=Bugula neritina TaxID=10212 RepID=A0A7J7K553_BUGNE|nr:CCDC94 [Bugula neritina]
MTERKTLNRYYPVEYDPVNIPKLKAKKKEQNRLWGIRVMAPFNMRCNTCRDYIYKGKKLNSKKETVSNEDYLGIEIHRFYIRCPKCVAVIAFKTDPKNCDYTLETGATRNFEAAKTLMDQEKKKQQAIEDEEAANPMKVLENRTKQSRNEMDTMEALTELREMNARHEKVDHEAIIRKAKLYQQELEQKEEEDCLIRELFGFVEEVDGERIRRLASDDEDDALPVKRAKV